ncbi:inverted formin-2-like isoform X1 [Mauremys mutica]|uniref:inverted formin-2-like isoform X1 n=3 Tax=Mauremys mutica TaxID=74926 RepID=UPI001D15FB43|nr:inverted formin-2-like isoform X1 [Mauremys mutica]
MEFCTCQYWRTSLSHRLYYFVEEENNIEEAMERLPAYKKCPNSNKLAQKRLVQKVNKCIQVDMDLEEESLSAGQCTATTICPPETITLSRQPLRTSENSLSSQLPACSVLPSQCASPLPALPPSLLPLPPPPPLCPCVGQSMVPMPPSYPPTCSNAAPGGASGHESEPCPKKAKTPTLRMKPFDWQKLPWDVVRESHSMWASVTSSSDEVIDPDYTSIEQLFCVSQTTPKETAVPKIKEPKEITFIDMKKSLLLNIFLKQFKCLSCSSNEEVANMIEKGDRTKFDADTLKQLMKLLPEKHEIENLKSCKEKAKLANADQFYLLLLGITSYQLRIECMLFCEETSSLLDLLWPEAQMVRRACETLLTSHRLPIFCQLILKVGNFLNYGRHTGDAGGFKINTLLKLTEIKANQTPITLLHHILEEVEKNHTDLLQLPNDLECVSKAEGTNFEVMKAEADAHLKKLLKIEHNMSSIDDLKAQYGKSIQGHINGLKELEEELAAIKKKKAELADYLCEDRNKLSLQDVFNTMKTFRDLFIKALKENQERKEQATKAEKRKKLLEEEEAKRQKGEYGNIIQKGDVRPEACVTDALLVDIRKGFQLWKTTRNKSESEIVPKTSPTETASVTSASIT